MYLQCLQFVAKRTGDFTTHENLTCEKSLWNTSVESYHFMIAVHLCFHECTFQRTFWYQIKCRKQALKTLSFKNKFWSFLDSSAIEFLYPCPENFISNNTITFPSIKEIIEFDILIWECSNFVSARIQSYTSQTVYTLSKNLLCKAIWAHNK